MSVKRLALTAPFPCRVTSDARFYDLNPKLKTTVNNCNSIPLHL